MLNQDLELCIEDLNTDKNMKLFIKEILIYELSNIDEINSRYVTKYDNLVEKYLRKD